jgi:hypothetical protein
MGLIIATRSPQINIAGSSLNLGDRLQHQKENHLSKTCHRVSYINPKIGDGTGRLNNDFGNAAITPKISRQKIQGSLYSPAD